jgi:hypothetical protein
VLSNKEVFKYNTKIQKLVLEENDFKFLQRELKNREIYNNKLLIPCVKWGLVQEYTMVTV